MICEKCGAQLPENAKFCLECGNPVSNLQPEEVKSVFDELQVEEVDSDSFFGQFSSSPVEEVNPPVIEDNTNIVESVQDIPLQEEVVSDPFGITPNLKSCIKCGNTSNLIFIDINLGGALCSNCINEFNNINIWNEYYYEKKKLDLYSDTDFKLLLNQLRNYYLNYLNIKIKL